MYAIIKKEERTALREYIKSFDDPHFANFLNSDAVGQDQELPLMTYRKLLVFSQQRQLNDPSQPHFHQTPASAYPLHEIRKMAYASKKDGVEKLLTEYEIEQNKFDSKQIGSISVGEFKVLVTNLLGGIE
jgi:hypothetical protein